MSLLISLKQRTVGMAIASDSGGKQSDHSVGYVHGRPPAPYRVRTLTGSLSSWVNMSNQPERTTMDVEGGDLVVKVSMQRANAGSTAVGYDLLDHTSHTWEFAGANMGQGIVEHPRHASSLSDASEQSFCALGHLTLKEFLSSRNIDAKQAANSCLH